MLFLWSQNLGEVVASQVTGPLLQALAAALGVLAVAAASLRSLTRGALVASGLAFLFFSYGHVHDVLGGGSGLHPLLLSLWALLAVAVAAAAVLLPDPLADATRAVNVAGLTLLLFATAPLANLVADGSAEARAAEPGRTTTLTPLPGAPEVPERDIWYLVFDRYSGERNLRDRFGFDNSEFTGFLESHGFEVVDEAIANYPKTAYSLASTLNLTYLDHLATAGHRSDDWRPAYRMLREHRLGEFLTRHGYHYTHIGGWWGPTSTSTFADETLRYDKLSEFEAVLRDTTALPALHSLLRVEEDDLPATPSEHRLRQRNHTAYQLDQLDRLAAPTGRNGRRDFVFAHLTLPHRPFVFAADGRYVSAEEERSRTHDENFIAQVRYANLRLRTIVEALLDGPEESHPIVVLQADEGENPPRLDADIAGFVYPSATDSELRQKFEVLSAYYFPDGVEVYPEITPVNTFRLLLDAYFGTDLGLVPDRAVVYYNEYDLHRFSDVTDRLRPDPIRHAPCTCHRWRRRAG